MKPFSPLLFPTVSPSERQLSTLLALFDTVDYYHLPQADIPPEGSLLASDRVRARMPFAMDEEEQQRFQLLIRDLKGNEGEFYGGFLSSISASGMTPDEDTVWSIFSSLTKGTEAKKEVEEKKKEELWQAMLLLKLAEMLQAEEADIARGLDAISERQSDLLSSLKGGGSDEEEEAELAGLLSETTSRTAINPERLTRAWGYLFRADCEAPPLLLATSSKDGVALLADIYESRMEYPPITLGSITLPSTEDDSSRLQEKTSTARKGLHDQLNKLDNMGEIEKEAVDAFGVCCRQWDEALGMTEEEGTLLQATFYAYSGLSLTQLFRTLLHKKEEDAEGVTSGILMLIG